jgi:hypothetical protein
VLPEIVLLLLIFGRRLADRGAIKLMTAAGGFVAPTAAAG